MSTEVEEMEVAEEQPVKRKTASGRAFDFNAFESNTVRHEFKIPPFDPIILHVRTDAITGADLAGFNRKVAEMETDARSMSVLKQKRAALYEEQAALTFVDLTQEINESELEEEELNNLLAFREIEAEIKEVDSKLEELRRKPTTLQELKVDIICLPMLADWDATRDGVKVEVTRENLLSTGVRFIELLAEELQKVARGNIAEQKKVSKRVRSKSRSR